MGQLGEALFSDLLGSLRDDMIKPVCNGRRRIIEVVRVGAVTEADFVVVALDFYELSIGLPHVRITVGMPEVATDVITPSLRTPLGRETRPLAQSR